MDNTLDKSLCMGWNDTIENDGQEFVLLPEGDYNFTVTNFERGTFPGSAKIPTCNKATITVAVDSPKGKANVRFDLLLYKSLEWKLAAFFRCIGAKKSGESIVMDWNKVMGAMGTAHFKQKTYINKNGEEKTINDLDKFYDYDSKNFGSPVPGFVAINQEDIPF